MLFQPLTRVKSAHHDASLNEKQLSGQLDVNFFSKGNSSPSALLVPFLEQTLDHLSCRCGVMLNAISKKACGLGCTLGLGDRRSQVCLFYFIL